jgi:hypothetical protein
VLCPAKVVQAAFDLCRPKERKGRLFMRVARFFKTRMGLVPEGMEGLPRCWLVALPAILAHVLARPPATPPCRIDAVACHEGMLLLRFVQEPLPLEGGVALGDCMRVTVNASVYPSIWRPLSRRHYWAIRRTHPELHTALAGQDIDV